MPGYPANLTEFVPIDDFSNDTLLQLAERLERSETFQQLIAREAELDEIYRRVETAMIDAEERAAPEAVRAALAALFRCVFDAHDLAGNGEPLVAARRLRDAMSAAAW